jgi:hypothetical protein
MLFVLTYRAGHVPPAELDANVAALDAWVERLAARPEHRRTWVFGTVTSSLDDAMDEHPVFGMSEVECEDRSSAEHLVAGWPEHRWGGAVEVCDVAAVR